MAKAASVAMLMRKFSSKICPWEMFLAAFTTITPPSARYAITNTGRVALVPKPLCSMISPATKSTAPMIMQMISMFSLEKNFFLEAVVWVAVFGDWAFGFGSFSFTRTSDSMDVQILRIWSRYRSGFFAVKRSCFVAKVMVASEMPSRFAICSSILEAQWAQPRFSRR